MRFAFSRLFYQGKHIRKENKDNLTALLLPSMLGIFACVVCLMGMTFAWFSATQETQTQTIQAANYSASVLIDGEAASETAALAIGTHTVSITADGTATTGYFVIEYGDQKLHTAQVGKDGTISFTFEVNEAVTLNITPQWGTSAKPEDEKIKEGDTLIFGEPAPLVCTCETKCKELNAACEVCKNDIALCIGKEITCACEIKCTELNADCEVCKTDFALCVGAEATPPEAPADENPPADEQGEQPGVGEEQTTPPDDTAGDVTATDETMPPAEQESTEGDETTPPADVSTAPAILPSESSEDDEGQQQDQQNEQE